MQIVKRNGMMEPFNPSKVRKWVSWAVSSLENKIEAEYYILTETLKRLPEKVTTEEIHEIMINVCLDKEDILYSRIASHLEKASIFKSLEHAGFLNPSTASFSDLVEFFEYKKLWAGSWLNDLSESDLLRLEDGYLELEAMDLEYWTIKQWSDKYAKKLNDRAIETPAMGILALFVAVHGVTDLAFDCARDVLSGKVNLPTPVMNGIRDGSWDTISCSVIEGGDTVSSINVATWLASEMTAKKAGIGITLDTRSKGDKVKNGAVKHLGKQPLVRAIESGVKMFTQVTRGGSATVTIKAIDPDIMSMLLWKTQRIDIAQRVDKVDYSFAYNDAFVQAVLHNQDWHLFSLSEAPEVHKNFHKPDYLAHVKKALSEGKKSTKIKALDVLLEFGKSRWETGRLYCLNVTRANEHTPFRDEITQSNLCMEIMLPTAPFSSMKDVLSESPRGEMAFCALSALNAEKLELEEYFTVAERALRTVDVMIERAPTLTPGLGNLLRSRRSVGIGITGLAGYLYKNGLDYDGSYESLVATEQLAATHYYALLQASQKMAEESGFHVGGIDQDWLPIDTAKFVTTESDWGLEYDWEALRGKPRKHSVLVAHMPTESSAVFSGATNGVYPSRERVVYKSARTGKVQFISQYYGNTKTKCWDVDMIPYYQCLQNHADQGISADHYTDYTKYPDMKIPDVVIVKWFVHQAMAGIKSAYYQNFKDTVSAAEADCSSCKL